MTIDSVLAKMKLDKCIHCNCIDATYDESKEEVIINGSFCYPVEGHPMIQITAINKISGKVIWDKECETGQTCSIPFTSDQNFNCY